MSSRICLMSIARTLNLMGVVGNLYTRLYNVPKLLILQQIFATDGSEICESL